MTVPQQQRQRTGWIGSYFLATLLSAINAVTLGYADDRPNVVLIMADDVGVECFGCYGSEVYSTPHLDQLAANGMRFTNCHSNPLCTPSRVKIMTGKSNIRNYFDFSIFPQDEPTIAHWFGQSGYRTMVAGKWQLLGAEHYKQLAGTGITPRQAGFDEYCLWQVEKLGSRYWAPLLDINGQLQQFDIDQYGPDICVDHICDFITRSHGDGTPFLVYYPMILPHNPFQPTPASTDRESKNKKQNFIDMVGYLDHLVGRISNHVEETGIAENTLLLFVSDNGTNRAITSDFQGRQIQGGKGQTLDTGTHVPMIAHWPSKIADGSICEDLIDLSDFVPTLANIASVPLPEDSKFDGVSFAPQLFGKPGTAREWIYCFYHPRPRNKNQKAVAFVRDEQWKLYDDGRLYDVQSDPQEQRPLVPESDNESSRAAREHLQAGFDAMPASSQKINSR